VEEQKELALPVESSSSSESQSSSSTNGTAQTAPSDPGTQPSGKRKKVKKYRLKKLVTAEQVEIWVAEKRFTLADFEEVKEKKRAPDEPKEQTNAAFWMFWRMYPKKDIVGAALRQWKLLQPDSETVEKIVRDLAKRVKSFDWTKDGGKWIPYAHTYLANKRWLDEGIDQSLIQRRTVL
jgi:hypothetical protein